MTDWRLRLYPELRNVPEPDRERVWRLAKNEAFRFSENLLVLAGIVAAAVVVKYAGFRALLGSVFLGTMADFITAAFVLLVIAGPAYWRRLKRGLAAAAEKPRL